MQVRRGLSFPQLPFVIFILISPLVLQMCSRDTEPSTLRMVNGSLPTAAHPSSWSAVALVDPFSGESFCSGTLIAPDLVVTAAHCIFDKRPEEIEVFFGPLVKDRQSPRLKVVAKDTFKKFQKFESNFDIGWVRLAQPAPEGYRPLEIWQDSTLLQPGKDLSIAGYGRTASQCADGDEGCQGGQLLYVDTSVQEFVKHGRLFSLIVIGPRPDHGPCFGDSGGPAYVKHDGTWYLAGDFMGWDRILVSENLDTICDTGHAIYNFVGDYVRWIEETSGVTLTYNANINPRPAVEPLNALSETPVDFAGWCAYDNHEDPAWFTVQRLIRLASDYRLKADDPAKAREVFEDCAVAEVWLRKMLAADPKLTIPGYDPTNFVDSARLEDVRPLASLATMGIEELVLNDHSIEDLSPIAQLTTLKHLEIVDNTVSDRRSVQVQPSLRIQGFAQLEDLRIHNSFAPVDLGDLSQLKKLKRLELSHLDLASLSGLERLPLRTLMLDNLVLPQALDLTMLAGLESLRLEKINVSGLPESMASLHDLALLEVQGLRSIPSSLPTLQKFTLYASDFSGELNFHQAAALEELSIISNKNIRRIRSISDMPLLKSLDIVENQLDGIDLIARLPALKEISLMKNGLRQMPLMEDLPLLEKLDFDGNLLSAVGNLSAFPQLVYLNLNRNPLKSLKGLNNLPALKRLSVQNEPGEGLTSLQGLGLLGALEELNLSGNSLTSVAELAPFRQLKVLILTDNRVTDLAPLKDLTELEYLEAVNNPLVARTCPSKKPNACRFEWFVISDQAKIGEPVVNPT